MNNTKKIVTFAVLSAMPIIANAGFMAYYPLEVKLGGSLPDGSINMGNGNGTPTDPTGPTEPSNKCEYDSGTKLIGLKIDNAPFLAGDVIIMYAGRFIGAQSPSNGLSVPAGITSGAMQTNTAQMMEAEVCGDNLSSYPTLPMPTGTPPDGGNASPVTLTETITYNDCPEARAGLMSGGKDHFMGFCALESQIVRQALSLKLDDANEFSIFYEYFSSEDKENINLATTISTSTGKSCFIDRRDSYSVGCYNKTLILENEVGSTITFTIK